MKKMILIAAVLATTACAAAPVKLPQSDNPWFKAAEKAIEEKMARRPIKKRAKNIILFIADGSSVGTNYATRLFMGQQAGGYGDEYVLPHERFPYLALSKTYNTNAQTPDSAGTATAMNTGVKTRAGVIGLSEKARPGECADVKTAMIQSFAELMHLAGKSIGVVSTAHMTHATPAAVYAHAGDRNWEDDSTIPEDCDQKDIAVQLYEKITTGQIDIALGGGRRHFIPEDLVDEEGEKGNRRDGRNLIAEARSKGVQYAWDEKNFASLALDGKRPILGLFESSHIKYAHDRTGEPALAEMTAAAITHLSTNDAGYYLMVEAGRVDHANHAGNAHRTLTDNAAFARAVGMAAEMTSAKDTLIIVTADHGHAMAFNGYCGRGSSITGLCYKIDRAGVRHASQPNLGKDGKPYTVIGYLNGPGSVVVKGDDGLYSAERPDVTQAEAVAPDYVQQALVPMWSDTHTGEDVAIYARGPWAHLVDGTVEQNYIFHVMNYAVHAW